METIVALIRWKRILTPNSTSTTEKGTFSQRELLLLLCLIYAYSKHLLDANSSTLITLSFPVGFDVRQSRQAMLSTFLSPLCGKQCARRVLRQSFRYGAAVSARAADHCSTRARRRSPPSPSVTAGCRSFASAATMAADGADRRQLRAGRPTLVRCCR